MNGGAAFHLLRRLFDDAALFPPGNARMADAVPAHDEHRRAWYGPLIGPFICTDRRLDELRAALDGRSATAPLDVSLIITGGRGHVGSAVAEVDRDARLRLVSIEIPSGGSDVAADVSELVTAMAESLSDDVAAYVELPSGSDGEGGLDVLAGSGRRAKLRTGGETAGAFPSEEEVAAFLVGCLDRKVAFKCTAGLHNAVRHTDPATGFEHHGYLNVLLAVHVALQRSSPTAVAAMLAERDGDALVGQVRGLDEGAGRAIREWFRSYGTCSVTEPIDDAVGLGLLESP